jgi:hypothetical protein
MDLLLSACSVMDKNNYGGESCAYSEGEGKNCYLVLTDRKNTAGDLKFSFINEFGEPVRRTALLEYLSEHCEKICDNGAVEKLAELI